MVVTELWEDYGQKLLWKRRLRLFNEYFQEHHGTLDEDCQQVIQVILNAHDAIRAVDQDNHVAQEHANEAR